MISWWWLLVEAPIVGSFAIIIYSLLIVGGVNTRCPGCPIAKEIEEDINFDFLEKM